MRLGNNPDFPAVLADQREDNRQAQAGFTGTTVAGPGRVSLVEAFEDILALLLGHPDPGILDAEGRPMLEAPAPERNRPVIGKLDGVLGQVDQHLLEAVLVSINRQIFRSVKDNLVPVLSRVLGQLLLNVVHDRPGIELGLHHLDLPASDLFVVQVFVDQADQALGFPTHEVNGLWN